MLRKVSVVALFFVFAIGIVSTDLLASAKSTSDSTYFLRLSIWPKKLSWPKKSKISGISLGLPSSYGVPLATGADLSLIWGDSQNVHGFKAAPVCTGAKLKGVQLAVFNKTDDINGGEIGVVNLAKESAGIQLGIYNKSEANKGGAQLGIVNFARNSDNGVQIGIINIMKNGFLPIFPFFNFPVN